MLLLFPPAVRVSEPPIGIARVAAFLRERGIDARCLDLNLACCLELLSSQPDPARPVHGGPEAIAYARRDRDLAALRDPATYRKREAYVRAVAGLSSSLKAASAPHGIAGLADYRDAELSPLRSADLERAFAEYGRIPYFPAMRRAIDEALRSRRTRAVGVSIVYLSQALAAMSIAGYIRSAYPETRLFAGGGLITSWGALGHVARAPAFARAFDGVFPGPGESRGLEAFAASLADGSPRTASASRARPSAMFATPRFDDFDLDAYLSPGRVLPYNFSLGCPWRRCVFCPERYEGAQYRCVARATGVAQARELAERHEPALFHFTDSEVSQAHLSALAESPPGAPWYGFARFSTRLEDPSFCRALAASGCAMLQLGLESGDDDVLAAMGKGITVAAASRILANVRDAGIETYVYIMFGTPREGRDAAMRTRDFVAQRSGSIGFLNVSIYNMPSRGEDAANYPAGPSYDADLSLYAELDHPAGWNRPEIRRFLSREFSREPSIRNVLARTPPVFTSNHAPFFARG
jgi:radical SAM superfamily enzyme YgiQ (UPF0313 family)